MDAGLIVTMSLRETEARLLIVRFGQEVMRATLGISLPRHPRAFCSMLEGLSLLHQQRLRVVLSAESQVLACEFELVDPFGVGLDTVFYTVETAPRMPMRRRPSVRRSGNFRDLYHHLWLVSSR